MAKRAEAQVPESRFDVQRYCAIVNLRGRAAHLYDQLRAEGRTHAQARAAVTRQIGYDLDWMRGGK